MIDISQVQKVFFDEEISRRKIVWVMVFTFNFVFLKEIKKQDKNKTTEIVIIQNCVFCESCISWH